MKDEAQDAAVGFHRAVAPEQLGGVIWDADLKFRLLSQSSPTTFIRVRCPRIWFDHAVFGPATYLRGRMSNNSYTLVFVTRCPSAGRSLSFLTQHSADMIGVFPPGREVEGVKPRGYEQAVITVPVDLFRSVVENCFPHIPRRVLVSGGVVSLGCRDAGRLRHLIADLLGAVDDPASQLVRPEALAALEDDLLTAFMEALSNSPQWIGASPGPRMTARYGLLRRALDVIESAPADRLQPGLLCLEIGRSRRCVEYLFKDLLGVSPGTYIRQIRLNSARRTLLASDPGKGLVKQAALDAGFWHFGKFAAHYRKLFGECPTETLRGLVPTGSRPFADHRC